MKISKMTEYTLLSTVASLAMRGLGIALNVFLTNKIGAEGIGLFTLIVSVYSLGISFAAAGYKLATTRLAVEDTESKNPNPVRLITRIILMALLTGTLAAMAVYFFSDYISVNILKEARCADALKILSFSLPLIASSSVISAYLGAYYRIIKVAIIQGSSQIAQIVFILLTINSFSDIKKCCDTVSLGSVIGEATALLIATLFLISELKIKKRTRAKKKILKPFLRIAVPDALGYDLRSCLSTVQHLLIPIGFRKRGSSASYALSMYGIMHGMALQVVLFPSCILRSLATLLVPKITESRTRKDDEKTKDTIRRVLHMTIVFSFCVTSVMFFCSDNIAETLYNTPECSGFLRLFAPLVPIMYLDISVDSMLKGLDKQVASMGYNLLDSAVSVLLVYLLIPPLGVTGYLIMVFATEIMNTSMSLYKLLSVSLVKMSLFGDVIIPLACAVGAGCIGKIFIILFGLPHSPITLILQIFVNVLSYAALIFAISSETRDNTFRMLGIKAKAAS